MALVQTPEPEVQSAEHLHRTAKVVELVCCSTKSFEDAIQKGLSDAEEHTRGITGAKVTDMTVRISDNMITQYRVALKVAFGVEHSPHP